jgi:hypothetical protein
MEMSSHSDSLVQKRKWTTARISTNDDIATELHLRAQAFQRTAQILVTVLLSDSVLQEWDAWPVISLYRQALELHLKGIVLGPGANCLFSRPNSELVCRTHSLRYLQSTAKRILRGVERNRNDRRAVEHAVARLRAVVGWIDAVDDSYNEVRFARGEIQEFAKTMDYVIAFLDATGHTLTATLGAQHATVQHDEGASSA